jgi:hypothetical protein
MLMKNCAQWMIELVGALVSLLVSHDTEISIRIYGILLPRRGMSGLLSDMLLFITVCLF